MTIKTPEGRSATFRVVSFFLFFFFFISFFVWISHFFTFFIFVRFFQCFSIKNVFSFIFDFFFLNFFHFFELYNDNLKMFNQAWEETLAALGNDLDEGVLEQWESPHSWRTLHRCTSLTLFWKRSREATGNPGPWWMTSSSSNSRTCWLLKKSSVNFLRGAEERQTLSLLDVKRLGLERRKMFFWTWPGKEREGQRKSIKKPGETRHFCRTTIRQKDREKVHLERKIILSVSTMKEKL